jgi:GntR family transcriptional regulator/MocR family aminotransferase
LERKYYGTARTFYVGSLTKTLFPGLRLGYMIVPNDLLKEFIVSKSSMDIHHTSLGQASLAHFIAKHFPQHIKRMQDSYIKRQVTLVENILEKVGDHIKFEKGDPDEIRRNQYKNAVDAGIELTTYATTLALKRGFNDQEFSEYLMAEKRGNKKVKARPLSSFYIDKTASTQGLVLGFAGFDDEEIIEGVNRLQEHFEAYFADIAKN